VAHGKVCAIVLAAGSSRRMGADKDKLLQIVARRPLLAHSLLAFDRCDTVDEIILVVREDRQDSFKTLASEHGVSKLVHIVPGGLERQDSVWRGLQALSAFSEIVLIHDGARPCVTSRIITRCVEVARLKGAAIPASRVKDTIKKVTAAAEPHEDGTIFRIDATLNRSELWAAQTPQTFRVELIRRAYEPLIQKGIIVTDDAAAVERLGQASWIVESDPLNIKITTPEDLLLADTVLCGRSGGG